jgi:hypothetical protein
MQMRSIGIGVMVAALVLGALVVGSTAGASAYFNRAQVTGSHSLSTWQCLPWLQTTQSDFQSDIAVNVNTSANPGSVILGNQTITQGNRTITFPSVYGMHGNIAGSHDTYFSLYNISNSTWVSVAVTLDDVDTGSALTYSGNGNIIAFYGNDNRYLWQYNISANTWSSLSTLPDNHISDAGSALAYTENGNISVLDGLNTDFWEYNLSTNTWRARASPSVSVADGAALTYTKNGNVSALYGGSANFYEYNISTNAWRTRASIPNTAGTGSALAYMGNGNISAFDGGTTNFWVYNMSTNVWNLKARTPANTGAGASLTYTEDGNVLAFLGGNTKTFWQYNISTNTSTTLASAPYNVNSGGNLVYAPRNVAVSSYSSAYVPYGNLTSVVNNTGHSGTTWYSLVWTGSITPGVTNITFRVRASDTSFAPAAASPAWVTVGWPSPVTSGLPSGQYFQWQAILTTTDLNKTPRLDEVSLCYS